MASVSMTSLSLVFLAITSSSAITDVRARSQDLVVAIEEMQRATYFTYVVLINMAPQDLIRGNVTFLMPSDRILANTTLSRNDVADFLLRHSIPTPLLFEHLQYFPTSSIIPSSEPNFMLRVLNINGDGRHFFLNNVRITSPNICSAGSSIRCHGIDGVLVQDEEHDDTRTFPSATCTVNATTTPVPAPVPVPVPVAATASPPPAAALQPPDGGLSLTPLIAPSPTESPRKSSSSRFSGGGLFQSVMMTCVLIIAAILPV